MFEERPTRAHIRKFYRPFYRRPVFWLGLLGLMLIVARLALDPLATHYTREALRGQPGIAGDFADVQVGVLPPHYGLTHLKVIETTGGSWKEPLFYAEQIDAHLDGSALLRLHLAVTVRIDRPKLTVVRREGAGAPGADRPARLSDVRTLLAKAPPLDVRRVDIRRGEVLFRDATTQGAPELWVHRLEAALENLATRPALAEGRPTVLTARATVQRSGELTTFLSFDPFAEGLTFAGRTQLRGLELAELQDLLVGKAALEASRGTIDLFADYRAEGGVISGSVKPVLKNVEIEPAHGGLGGRLRAWLADKSVDLVFSDRVPGGNAVATAIPLKGTITDPQVPVLPTVLGIVRNAFVEGLTSGFAKLPPRAVDGEEGTSSPVKDAPTGGAPPQAQPAAPGNPAH